MLPRTPMPDESDPPRQMYQLKPKQFEAVNDSIPPVAPGVASAPDPGPSEGGSARIDVRDLCKQAGPPVPLRGATARRNQQPGNDVHAILQHNEACADAAGLNQLAPQAPKRSRRKRDYWISLIGMFGLLALGVFIAGPNVMSLAFAVGGSIILGIGLTWIFWVVLDDY